MQLAAGDEGNHTKKKTSLLNWTTRWWNKTTETKIGLTKAGGNDVQSRAAVETTPSAEVKDDNNPREYDVGEITINNTETSSMVELLLIRNRSLGGIVCCALPVSVRFHFLFN